jgi:predicted nucleic acid-binding protein
MIRTFFDSGVLIAGAKGIPAERAKALDMLRDPGRQFLTSPFLHLEVVPKAVFNKNRLEERFYEIYFRNAEWFHDSSAIVELARKECAKSGLNAMDGLHVAAAHLLRADEFVTTEKPAKSIYRSTLVKIVYLVG